MKSLSPSLIIPSRNEAKTIRRCLQACMADATKGKLEVVVICNGCSDDTAKVARQLRTEANGSVNVIETDVPSKRNALNLGDRAAGRFPRFYVDADVTIALESILRVATILDEGNILAAAPTVRFDVSKSSWPVRAFYRIWSALPYFQSGMIGSGVYAVSEEGRKRWGEFPEIIADDAFVRLHFAPHERKVVRDCEFVVTAPRTLWGLIKIKTRSHLGNIELRMKYPHLMKNQEVHHAGGLARLGRNPLNWLDLGVYGLVKLVTRFRAWRQVRQGKFSHWERDETSRQPAPLQAGGR